jgi:hypothetical protein
LVAIDKIDSLETARPSVVFGGVSAAIGRVEMATAMVNDLSVVSADEEQMKRWGHR